MEVKKEELEEIKTDIASLLRVLTNGMNMILLKIQSLESRVEK